MSNYSSLRAAYVMAFSLLAVGSSQAIIPELSRDYRVMVTVGIWLITALALYEAVMFAYGQYIQLRGQQGVPI